LSGDPGVGNTPRLQSGGGRDREVIAGGGRPCTGGGCLFGDVGKTGNWSGAGGGPGMVPLYGEDAMHHCGCALGLGGQEKKNEKKKGGRSWGRGLAGSKKTRVCGKGTRKNRRGGELPSASRGSPRKPSLEKDKNVPILLSTGKRCWGVGLDRGVQGWGGDVFKVKMRTHPRWRNGEGGER